MTNNSYQHPSRGRMPQAYDVLSNFVENLMESFVPEDFDKVPDEEYDPDGEYDNSDLVYSDGVGWAFTFSEPGKPVIRITVREE